MSLPVILALVDPAHGAATLKLAGLASDVLDAAVDVIVIKPDPRDAIPAIAEAMTGEMVAQIMASTEAAGEERAVETRALFDAFPPGQNAAFIEAVGREDSIIAREGRTRALTVLPSSDRSDGETLAIGAALFETGRPTLIAPPHAVGSLGKRVAIFWKDSKEAAAAVWAAAPFLRQAELIKVFTVGDDVVSAAALDRIGAGLKRAGILVELESISPKGGADIDLLSEAARSMNADLIVMGAYSRSRLREQIFGGVTLEMLETLALPVLMAH